MSILCFSRAFSLSAALWLLSCALPEYPEKWPGLRTIEAGRCPYLAGAFKEFGSAGNSGCPESCRLSFYLFPGKVGGSHVRITQYDDTRLEFQLLRGDELIERRSLSAAEQQFACTASGLELSKSGYATSSGLMHEEMTTHFRRGEDHSLIAQVKRSAAGIIGLPTLLPVFLPAGFRESAWIKWDPVFVPATGASSVSGLTQTAQTENPELSSFYREAPIKLVLGYLVNTELDRHSRWVSAHFRRHIAGSPNVVVENIPGFASLIVARYIMERAAPDGRTIAVFAGDPALWKVTTASGKLKLDWQKLEWIGGIESIASKERAFFAVSADVPKERADHLREAFASMARDPEFLSGAPVKAFTAKEVKASVAAYYKIL